MSSESILASVKKMLGLTEDFKQFDLDIITDINSAFFVLYQLGVGTVVPFQITGYDEKWEDFVKNKEAIIASKTYIYMKVKLMFDPPSSSTAKEALNSLIDELEWRLRVEED